MERPGEGFTHSNLKRSILTHPLSKTYFPHTLTHNLEFLAPAKRPKENCAFSLKILILSVYFINILKPLYINEIIF